MMTVRRLVQLVTVVLLACVVLDHPMSAQSSPGIPALELHLSAIAVVEPGKEPFASVEITNPIGHGYVDTCLDAKIHVEDGAGITPEQTPWAKEFWPDPPRPSAVDVVEKNGCREIAPGSFVAQGFPLASFYNFKPGRYSVSIRMHDEARHTWIDAGKVWFEIRRRRGEPLGL